MMNSLNLQVEQEINPQDKIIAIKTKIQIIKTC